MNDSERTDIIGLLGPLQRYARSLTRDHTLAEDLVQDTLVRAFERKGTFVSGGNLRGWLLSILHNTFVEGRRRQVADAARLRKVAETVEISFSAGQESYVHLQQIQSAFLHLPEDQRATLHLVAIEGMSYQDAAAVLHIPVGTLMSRLGRARAALRELESAQNSPQVASAKRRPALRVVGGEHD